MFPRHSISYIVHEGTSTPHSLTPSDRKRHNPFALWWGERYFLIVVEPAHLSHSSVYLLQHLACLTLIFFRIPFLVAILRINRSSCLGGLCLQVCYGWGSLILGAKR